MKNIIDIIIKNLNSKIQIKFVLKLLYSKVLGIYKNFSLDASATVAIKNVDNIEETSYVNICYCIIDISLNI